MYKMTLMDVLSTLDESPAIWNARADYWDNRALAHDRVQRDDQAARIRANVILMRERAAKMQRDMDRTARETKRLARIVPPTVVPVPAKPERAILTNAMSRQRVSGSFKNRDKGTPTIAESMVARGRARKPDAGDSASV